MGQKVNPHGARVGVILDWGTKWYAGKKDFSNNLIEDYNLRKMLKKELADASVSRIDIQRSVSKVTVIVYTAKPGIVVGQGGAKVQELKKKVEAFLSGKQVSLDVVEIKNPDTDAQLVAENIAQQLEKRISFRRAMKQTIGRAMKMRREGHQDHRVRSSGRRRYRAFRRLSRGFDPAADAAREHRLWLCRGEDHLWPHRR